MKQPGFLLRCLLLLTLTVGRCVFADVAAPVDRVDVRPIRSDAAEIIVRFLWPITVRSYAPHEHGKSIQVELGFLPGQGALAANTTMPPWRSGSDPVGSAIYESISLDGALDRATLSLLLAADFRFDVRRGIDARSLVVTVLTPGAALADASPGNRSAVSEAMAEADRALAAGEIDRAIALYTRMSAEKEGADAREALEKLGVARERKGQLAHAKAVYQDYLRRYPEGADGARVAQRLETLLAVDRPVAATVAAGGIRGAKSRTDWQVFGQWSQYYRYADQSIDRSGSPYFYGNESYTAQSDLLSRLDLRARKRGDTWGVDLRFGGGYLTDFRDDAERGGSHGDSVLLSDASIELNHLESDATLRVGRQYSSGDGVLGRFDGVRAGLPLGESLRLNLLGGRPVDRIYDTAIDDSQRYFYGASLNLQPPESPWQYTAFAIEQRIDDIEDRQAVGGELRYATAGRSLLALMDYDTGYGELNTVLVIGSMSFAAGTTLGVSADYRRSPLLTTRNALIGQPVDSIDELLEIYDESEVRRFAQARSADSHAVTLSLTQPLSERYQLYAGLSGFEYGDTDTAGGVPGFEGTGAEYGYEVQLIASDLWLDNDSHVFSVRYFDGNTTERFGLGINARYRLADAWLIQPRLWVEWRDSSRDGSDQWSLQPSLRLEYRWARRYHLELELGRYWAMHDIPLYGEEQLGSNYALLSYRVDFD